MNHSQNRRTDKSATERLLKEIVSDLRLIKRALNITPQPKKEYVTMADFTALVAEVEATKGDVASTIVFVDGLQKKIDELSANMNDAEDQAKVEALSADLKAIRSTLPKAIVANPEPTPA